MGRVIDIVCRGGATVVACWAGAVTPQTAAAAEAAPDSPAQNTITVPLEYRETAYSITDVGLSATARTDPFKKEPQPARGAIRRGRLNLPGTGSDSMAFIWDYRTLYLDLNRNEDLTDDPRGVFTNPSADAGRAPENFHYGSYKKVPLTLRLEEGEVPWLVDLNVSEYANRVSMYVSVRSFWAGKAVLEGRELQVGWVPGSERRPRASRSDFLLFRDWSERDRSFNISDGSLEAFSFPKKLFYQSAAYEVAGERTRQGDQLEHRIVFKEEPVDLGELNISGQYVRRLLLDGASVAVLDDPKGPLRVPVGRYPNHRVQLQKGESRAWLKQAQQAAVAIDAARPATLSVGGPLTNSATLSERYGTIVLDYKLLGAGGDDYTMADTDRQHPPRFAIYDGDRKVGSGNFEFG